MSFTLPSWIRRKSRNARGRSQDMPLSTGDVAPKTIHTSQPADLQVCVGVERPTSPQLPPPLPGPEWEHLTRASSPSFSIGSSDRWSVASQGVAPHSIGRYYPSRQTARGSSGSLVYVSNPQLAPPPSYEPVLQDLPESPSSPFMSGFNIPVPPLTPVESISLDPSGFTIGPQASFGGSCDLFVGSHPAYGKVALKRPRISDDNVLTESKRRFEREAAIWTRVSQAHMNILPFLGVIERDNYLYLVSSWMDGGDLRSALQHGRDLNKFDLLKSVSAAILYLHNEGIIHGDINAKNILLGPHNEPLLCDFGLAKIISDGMSTSTNMKGAGSVRWMAPELFRGASKSKASDVYAFGMTIVEIITGQPPYSHIRDTGRLIACILSGEELPPQEPLHSPAGRSYHGLWSIAAGCWEQDAARRPTMEEAYSLLSTI